jgi:hypothetical protein
MTINITELIFGTNHRQVIDGGDWDASTGVYPIVPANSFSYRYVVSKGGEVSEGSPPVITKYITGEVIIRRNGIWEKEVDLSSNQAGQPIIPGANSTMIGDADITAASGIILIDTDGSDRNVILTGTQDVRIVHYGKSNVINIQTGSPASTIATLNPGDGMDLLNPTGAAYVPSLYQRAEFAVDKTTSTTFSQGVDYDIIVGNKNYTKYAKLNFIVNDGTNVKSGEIILVTDGTTATVDVVQIDANGTFNTFDVSGVVAVDDLIIRINATSAGSDFEIQHRIEHTI